MDKHPRRKIGIRAHQMCWALVLALIICFPHLDGKEAMGILDMKRFYDLSLDEMLLDNRGQITWFDLSV